MSESVISGLVVSGYYAKSSTGSKVAGGRDHIKARLSFPAPSLQLFSKRPKFTMSGKSAVLAKHDDDVVVVAAYRTAITKVGV